VKWLHLAALAFSIALQTFSWICPLTHLEAWLRTLGVRNRTKAPSSAVMSSRLCMSRFRAVRLFAGTLIVVALSLWLYLRPRPQK